jgi:hypothetical protein
LNGHASDLITIHELHDNKFINVEEGAMGFFMSPPKGWANLKDCGDFPCTAPLNVIFDFNNNKFEGEKPKESFPNF